MVRVRPGVVVAVIVVCPARPGAEGGFGVVVRVGVPVRGLAALAAFASVGMVVLVLVVLAASFDGAFVVGVETDSCACFAADPTALFAVGSGAGRGGFFEEEVEELVVDGEVGGLLELLEGGEAEEGLEQGERGADGGEEGGAGDRCGHRGLCDELIMGQEWWVDLLRGWCGPIVEA